MRILLLGGTGDALKIARRLGPRDVYSLAGLGKVPGDLACQVRVGGFGGAKGLAAYVQAQGIALVFDATHPYAAQISANAATAGASAGVPLWALRRQPWSPQPGDDWRIVDDWAAIRAALSAFARPLFTLGREPLAHLDEIAAHQFWTVRCLDDHPGHRRARVVGARGPFTYEAEQVFFEEGRFDVLVSKNSGGQATEAKLDVARARGLPVIMTRRPALPVADRTFEAVCAVLDAIDALRAAADAPRWGRT
nr:cobalt-precorrin-6A reductase [Bordetella sp. FB-8]